MILLVLNLLGAHPSLIFTFVNIICNAVDHRFINHSIASINKKASQYYCTVMLMIGVRSSTAATCSLRAPARASAAVLRGRVWELRADSPLASLLHPPKRPWPHPNAFEAGDRAVVEGSAAQTAEKKVPEPDIAEPRLESDAEGQRVVSPAIANDTIQPTQEPQADGERDAGPALVKDSALQSQEHEADGEEEQERVLLAGHPKPSSDACEIGRLLPTASGELDVQQPKEKHRHEVPILPVGAYQSRHVGLGRAGVASAEDTEGVRAGGRQLDVFHPQAPISAQERDAAKQGGDRTLQEDQTLMVLDRIMEICHGSSSERWKARDGGAQSSCDGQLLGAEGMSEVDSGQAITLAAKTCEVKEKIAPGLSERLGSHGLLVSPQPCFGLAPLV